MKEIKEIDFSNSLHHSLDANSNNVLVTFYDGNSLRVSWDLINSLIKFKQDKK